MPRTSIRRATPADSEEASSTSDQTTTPSPADTDHPIRVDESGNHTLTGQRNQPLTRIDVDLDVVLDERVSLALKRFPEIGSERTRLRAVELEGWRRHVWCTASINA